MIRIRSCGGAFPQPFCILYQDAKKPCHSFQPPRPRAYVYSLGIKSYISQSYVYQTIMTQVSDDLNDDDVYHLDKQMGNKGA